MPDKLARKGEEWLVKKDDMISDDADADVCESSYQEEEGKANHHGPRYIDHSTHPSIRPCNETKVLER